MEPEYDECEHGIPYVDGACPDCVRRRHVDEVRALEAAMDRLQAECDEARAKVAATWLAGVAEGRRCATLSATAEAEERGRRERAQLLAWLRRPVDAEEAAAWLAERGIHAAGLQKRFDGGDTCWTDGKGGIVAHDWRISAARWAIADAIESGEPLSQPAPTAPK